MNIQMDIHVLILVTQKVNLKKVVNLFKIQINEKTFNTNCM